MLSPDDKKRLTEVFKLIPPCRHEEAQKRLTELLRPFMDNPDWDATDAAHPAWWRGEKYGIFEMAALIPEWIRGEKLDGAHYPEVEAARAAITAQRLEIGDLWKTIREQRDTISRLQYPDTTGR